MPMIEKILLCSCSQAPAWEYMPQQLCCAFFGKQSLLNMHSQTEFRIEKNQEKRTKVRPTLILLTNLQTQSSDNVQSLGLLYFQYRFP